MRFRVALLVILTIAAQCLLALAVHKAEIAEMNQLAACEAVVRHQLSRATDDKTKTAHHFIGTHYILPRNLSKIEDLPDSFYTRFVDFGSKVHPHSVPHKDTDNEWDWVLDAVQTGPASYAILGSYTCGPNCASICGYSVKQADGNWEVTVHGCLAA